MVIQSVMINFKFRTRPRHYTCKHRSTVRDLPFCNSENSTFWGFLLKIRYPHIRIRNSVYQHINDWRRPNH